MAEDVRRWRAIEIAAIALIKRLDELTDDEPIENFRIEINVDHFENELAMLRLCVADASRDEQEP